MTRFSEITSISVVIIIFLKIISLEAEQSNCHLDDLQKTPGVCKPIQQCPFVLGQLYAGYGPSNVKKCPEVGKSAVCCPSESTMSQKKCKEYIEILKSPEIYTQLPFKEPKCGYTGAKEFIVGGRDAHEFEFPYAVGLGYGDDPNTLDYNCGATLISDTYLLTAAHCINSKRGKPRWAVVGDLTLKEQTSVYRKKIAITQWIIHPNYTAPLIYNDIAILKLGERLELNRYVLPACLGDPVVTPKEGGVVWAIGWGITGFLDSQATRLQAVDLAIRGSKSCNTFFDDAADKSFRYPQGILRSQLCAGDRNPASPDRVQKDTCNGDSGGGLVVIDPQVKCLYHAIGVTSIGSKYCGYGEPGVYTKIVSYIDWIEKIIWK